MKVRILAIVSSVIWATGAFAAELPEGTYSGSVSEVSHNVYHNCQAQSEDLEIFPASEGYSLRWIETGRRNGDWSFCQNILSADLIPIRGRVDEWNVRFLWAHNLIFGRARLEDGVLRITASFSGGSTARFRADLEFSNENNRLEYRREIDNFSARSIASGRLRLRSVN